MNNIIRSTNLKIAIFFGGPSNERDISLDSARTLYDSIKSFTDEKNVNLYYISQECSIYQIYEGHIYSNTIDDFEKTVSGNQHVTLESISSRNVIFCPLVHGAFGEDGQLTCKLEALGVKAILGSSSSILKKTLSKFETNSKLRKHGFRVPLGIRFNYDKWKLNKEEIIAEVQDRFGENKVIVKPDDCGSSDGVSLIEIQKLNKACEKVKEFSSNILVEEKINGQEFSIILLEDSGGNICPLMPTFIQIGNPSENQKSVYSRTHKYLPGSGAKHSVLNAESMNLVRSEAKEIFLSLGLSNWARFDGFISDEKITWIDINSIPGFGQDSFFFQQCSLFGIDHVSASKHLLELTGNKINTKVYWEKDKDRNNNKDKIAIVGGGQSSERNVSRMSWANVIQKLNQLDKYEIEYVYQDSSGDFWKVPYYLTLQHTNEEIEECLLDSQNFGRIIDLSKKLSIEFHFAHRNLDLNFVPERIEFEKFNEFRFVFLALHGGDGENGTLQKKLEEIKIPFNGCGSEISKLCMNKSKTNQILRKLEIEGFIAPNQFILDLDNIKNGIDNNRLNLLISFFKNSIGVPDFPSRIKENSDFQILSQICSEWTSKLKGKLNSENGLVFKPLNDGCSSGVVVSSDPYYTLPIYLLCNWSGIEKVPMSLLFPDHLDNYGFLNMPSTEMKDILVEQFIEVDKESDSLMEITIGVLGEKSKMIALLPSQTIAEKESLTLIEKFQKGGGVNLTPPPALKSKEVSWIQKKIEAFANAVGIHGYSRIDAFYDKENQQLYLIEVNTLPGLTAATIIYTQAILSEDVNLRPAEFLDRIIHLSK